jgi:hypothetical protein
MMAAVSLRFFVCVSLILAPACKGASEEASSAAVVQAPKTVSGLVAATPPADAVAPASWSAATLPAVAPEPDLSLGSAVAADGSRIVIGAPGRASYPGPGRVFVYERSGDAWSLGATIVSATTREGDRFGSAVAIDGDTIVVGSAAIFDPSTGGIIAYGNAQVFTRGDDGWTHVTTLEPLGVRTSDTVDAIAVSGDVIAIGNPERDLDGETDDQRKPRCGAVSLWERKQGAWVAVGELRASDARELAATSQATFGDAIALAGDVLVVGARQAEPFGVEMSGAAYVFERRADGWTEVLRLPKAPLERWTTLGDQVATDGEHIAIAAGERGVWTLARVDGTWQDSGAIDEEAVGDPLRFGRVAIHGRRLAVGIASPVPLTTPPVVPGTRDVDIEALQRRRDTGAGEVWIYALGTGGWSREAQLTRAAAEAGDELGDALALGEGMLLAGAPRARPTSDGTDGGDVALFIAR